MSPVPVLEVIDAGAGCAPARHPHRPPRIIATPSRARGAYPAAIARRGGNAAPDRVPGCPLFVPMAEEGFLTPTPPPG
jgi:glutamate racemase